MHWGFELTREDEVAGWVYSMQSGPMAEQIDLMATRSAAKAKRAWLKVSVAGVLLCAGMFVADPTVDSVKLFFLIITLYSIFQLLFRQDKDALLTKVKAEMEQSGCPFTFDHILHGDRVLEFNSEWMSIRGELADESYLAGAFDLIEENDRYIFLVFASGSIYPISKNEMSEDDESSLRVALGDWFGKPVGVIPA